MIAFLVICYSIFYWVFFLKLKVFEKSVRNVSIFVGIGVALVGGIVFMWLTFAPTTQDGRVFQFVLQIIPNVKGEVIEVPAKPLERLDEGDVIYRIDPTPYQAAVDQLEASIDRTRAQRRRAEIEVERTSKLVESSAGAQRELDRWQASLDESEATIRGLEAQLRSARWQLDETVVRAPRSGRVVNLQLRPGSFVTSIPVAATLTFVSDEFKTIVSSFSQSAGRHIRVGDEAEVVLSRFPGRVFGGRVVRLIEATGSAQLTPSGQLPILAGTPAPARYPVLVELDDAEAMAMLPQGTGGMVAVYTQRGKPVHIITRVLMRMHAWLGYLTNPAA